MPETKTETLALLFTDIEGSTNLLRRFGDEFRKLLAEHRQLLRSIFDSNGGTVLGTEGDSFFVAFSDPVAAVRAAIEAQLALIKHPWPPDGEVRVRMGVHTGEVVIEAGDHYGLAIHQAARISNAAHGGQVLISDATRAVIARTSDAIAVRRLGRFRLKDFPDAQDLYQIEHPDLPSKFPEPRTSGGPRHNLPRAITSFVGRSREVAEISEQLNTARLFTLAGPGGCGKTRLAIEIGAALLGERDGVWFVDLTRYSDPNLVAAAAASALGIQEVQGQSLEETLGNFLTSGRPLLILDNCEHLIESCAELSEYLLSRCPGLTVLATAREPLGIFGETIRRVAPLEVPSADAADASSEAVQLFLERATAQDPDLVPAEKDLLEIGHITRRLDGIPLAIEMASALVGTLSLAEIASRLDDRFRLLTGGTGRGVGRQQTLLATVEWSHELLNEPERVLLRRLSLFSGSFSLDAVEGICAAGDLDPADVVSLMRRLVATSWVSTERSVGRARYRLLETSRQYALEKLIQAGEAPSFRSAHCRWFRELAEQASGHLLGGPEQVAWFDRVEAELDNFRTALAWSLDEANSATEGLRIATSLSRFWEVRGYWSEGWNSIEKALDLTRDSVDELRAPALIAGSFLAFYRGDLDRAQAMVDEGVEAAHRTGDEKSEARGVRFSAVIAQRVGGRAAALAPAKKAVELSRKAGEPADLAFALQVLGRFVVYDHPEDAARHYDEGLEVARRGQDAVSETYLLYAMGRLATRQGDDDRARGLFLEALEASRRVGERWMTLNIIAALSEREEEVEGVPAVREIVGFARQLGNRTMLMVWLRHLAYFCRMEGNVEEARRAVDEATEVARLEGTSEAQAQAHYIRGSQLDEGEQDYAASIAEFRPGLRLADELEFRWERAFGLSRIAWLLSRVGDHKRAAVLAGASERLREEVGMRAGPKRAEAYEQALEDISSALGQDEMDRLWTAGRNMPTKEAVALALEE